MSSNHEKYHYSATCKTDDPAVLHCLRALCQYSEKGEYPQIGWGGQSVVCGKQAMDCLPFVLHRHLFAKSILTKLIVF